MQLNTDNFLSLYYERRLITALFSSSHPNPLNLIKIKNKLTKKAAAKHQRVQRNENHSHIGPIEDKLFLHKVVKGEAVVGGGVASPRPSPHSPESKVQRRSVQAEQGRKGGRGRRWGGHFQQHAAVGGGKVDSAGVGGSAAVGSVGAVQISQACVHEAYRAQRADVHVVDEFERGHFAGGLISLWFLGGFPASGGFFGKLSWFIHYVFKHIFGTFRRLV